MNLKSKMSFLHDIYLQLFTKREREREILSTFILHNVGNHKIGGIHFLLMVRLLKNL
jgi:hypothetical protein